MDTAIQQKGSKAGFELGAPDFRVCALNGRIAKAPLGDNIQPLTCAIWKGDSAAAGPWETREAPMPNDQPRGHCFIKQWGQRL